MKTATLLLLLTTYGAAADKYCADSQTQPTNSEVSYAARVHDILIGQGINNNTNYLCGAKHTLVVSNPFMSEALAHNIAPHIGLGTAKASGYTLVIFSDEGGAAHDSLPEVWGYDLVKQQVKHGTVTHDNQGRATWEKGFNWQ